MKHLKKIEIKRKRIKKEDILQLSKIVEAEFSDNDYERRFRVNFWDDSSITDNSSDIFNNASFERKRTKDIHIEYYSHSLEKHIEIKLYDSTYLDGSQIEIDSNDQLWYEAMITKFTEFLQGVEKQYAFSTLFQSSVMTAICSLLGVLLSYASIELISNIIKANEITLTKLIQCFIIIIVFAINYFLCFNLGECLQKAFPTIEFCFGPEHMRSGLKIRKAIIWCIATFAPSIIIYLFESVITV